MLWERAGKPQGAEFGGDARKFIEDRVKRGLSFVQIAQEIDYTPKWATATGAAQAARGATPPPPAPKPKAPEKSQVWGRGHAGARIYSHIDTMLWCRRRPTGVGTCTCMHSDMNAPMHTRTSTHTCVHTYTKHAQVGQPLGAPKRNPLHLIKVGRREKGLGVGLVRTHYTHVGGSRWGP